jgi:hypothetical protein
MFDHTVLKRSLITCVAIGAAACPAAATARAIQPGDLGAPPPVVQPVHAGVVSYTASSAATDDFRWDDAGIGAAAAIVLLGAGGVAAGGLRRRHTQREVLS